jgi:hypothetical protein
VSAPGRHPAARSLPREWPESLRVGDLVIILAYGRIYAELAALLDEIARLRLQSFLITDTLADTLRLRVDFVLPVIILIDDPLKPQHAASTMGPGLRSAS